MRLLARTITLYLLAAVIAITVNFFIPRLMPGNPVVAAIGHMQARVTPATIRALDLSTGSAPSSACGASTCSTGASCRWPMCCSVTPSRAVACP